MREVISVSLDMQGRIVLVESDYLSVGLRNKKPSFVEDWGEGSLFGGNIVKRGSFFLTCEEEIKKWKINTKSRYKNQKRDNFVTPYDQAVGSFSNDMFWLEDLPSEDWQISQLQMFSEEENSVLWASELELSGEESLSALKEYGLQMNSLMEDGYLDDPYFGSLENKNSQGGLLGEVYDNDLIQSVFIDSYGSHCWCRDPYYINKQQDVA